MFEDDSADTLAGKFLLVTIWGRAEAIACADPVPVKIGLVRISFWFPPLPALMLFMDKFSGKIMVNFGLHKSYMKGHLCHFEL